jgi:predicted adenylyl cyclase CyaB
VKISNGNIHKKSLHKWFYTSLFSIKKMPTLFEFKAHCNNIQLAEEKLQTLNPIFIGEDHQIDTYFNVETGRLKLREGNIENTLIYYDRGNTANAKQSNVLLYKPNSTADLKSILTQVHGIKVVVDKRRKIYFVENVKFHFDTVATLGTFLEVEAIDTDGTIAIEKLQEQCNFYTQFFNIEMNDFIANSYSDLLLKK